MTDPISLEELNYHLESAISGITPEPINVRGTLTTWKRSKAWQRGELVTQTDKDIAARLSMGCTAKRGIGISRRIAESGRTLKTPVDVTVTGRLTFHPKYGLRFEVINIDPDTLAEAGAKTNKDELLASLGETQLLDRQRNLPNPDITKIGLITPQSGDAGRNDALAILSPTGIPIIEQRVLTGGPTAAASIVSAIAHLAPQTDIIAIVRGGGASSDLYVWDQEHVVTTIARCTTPIVVGVGHSIDNHVARQVAWHGADTPTAAAHHIHRLVTPPVVPQVVPMVLETVPAATPNIASGHGHITPAPIRPARTARKVAIAVLIVLALAATYWAGLRT